MSIHRRSSPIVVARHMRVYTAGERVRVLKGRLGGQIMTVRQSSNDWVLFKEALSREVMSKGNVEPEGGFTDEEMVRAKRAADKMQGLEAQ